MSVPDEVKATVQTVLDLCTTAFHYGYVPFVLWCGWKLGPDKGCEPFHLTHLLWHY
ncbi:unnamed protein product [Phyllotreta striolata]|uniref:Uncharacterized protein n=1 Tax=Phyllotreta striolata TaxID=444603 RepID=A0A9N9U221_PHYSR|nr:unnamed protein product [Phyllotreta striolata]